MLNMMEFHGGYLVLGLDGELYHVEHVWTTWSVRVAKVRTEPALIVIQEPWAKVQREGRA